NMTVAVFSESTVSASLTLGTVPLARVGPSLTTFKDRLYAFGGRTINPPKVTNDLYLFDLHHMACELVQPNEGSPLPSPRYFHSATMHEDKYLIISGGQGEQTNPDTPNVLNDICIYNIQTNEWEIFELNTTTFPSRYAHLTITKNNHLFIIGGQDADNQYLNDIYTFDLKSKELEKRCSISAGIGSYRSTLSICPGSNELFVFSNTRFNNPIRELITFDDNLNMNSFQFPQNRSDLPPALRFPEGYIIGDKLVISGTYISNNVQSYSLWTLDLKELTWSRIDTGSCFARGSWNRGILHPMNNQFLIFGHRDREIVEDYQHRRINFNHISVVNLEAFNIYRKPITCEDQHSVDLGLLMMYEPRYSNFALLTKDGFRIHINSGFLRSRWRNFDTYLTKRQDKDQALGIFSSNTLELQETYSTIQAFVRYLYTDNLDFDQAKNLKVLGKLLIFARNYSVHNLYDQAASHLHSMLDVDNALEIFEVSCTGKRDGLRLRSLSLIL
ncbi:galactose oxidase, partial [Neoconidiobolus thromboides FSU 785]